MNIYRAFYYLTILLLTAITGLLVYSVWSSNRAYLQMPPSLVSWEVPGQERANAQVNAEGWIQNALKLQHRQLDPHLIVITTRDGFTADALTQVNGNIVVFEQLFNQFSNNTYQVKQLTDLTGIEYSGFSGATYEDLSNLKNVPEKQVRLYEKNTGRKWNFFGEGIILTNDSTVLVLRRGMEYNGNLRLIANPLNIPYQGVFEITTSPNPSLAAFSIDLTPAGSAMFNANHLPVSFPAMYSIQRNLFKMYYFAGNFSHYNVDVPFNFAAIPWLMQVKSLYTRFTNEEAFWRWYYPTLNAIIAESEKKIEANQRLVPLIDPDRPVTFTVEGRNIVRNTVGGSEKFFMTGVNLGPALPGQYFTWMPEQKETYARWFGQIASLNVNTIRVYTLMPPAFYQALYEFNGARAASDQPPLYFLQEIWPEEHPQDNNYLGEKYNREYHQEIEFAVDAVHGNAQVPDREFRADGLYSYDVSPWLIGYLVGREMEPDEVNATDALNPGYAFKGEYFYSEPAATPTEAWLAASCDVALSIEVSKYKNRPLLSIVNWPTLDPIAHESERTIYASTKPHNDQSIVNINNIGITPGQDVGFFGSYHIYPNYPDFMNNDVLYGDYFDDQGVFRYGGYLRQFMGFHTRYPAVVAEYGISTSSVTAHFNPEGLNHGGLSEGQQAEYIIRMTNAILREGYSGAILFEWMNEWVKKTWSTDFYMIPYERHVLWHNVIDPEQNYGLISYEAAPSRMQTVYQAASPTQRIQSISVGQNASYLEIEISGSQLMDPGHPLPIAISTYALKYETEPIWEFFLNLDYNTSTKLLVNPGYNWVRNRFFAKPADFGEYQEMQLATIRGHRSAKEIVVPQIDVNLSQLGVGKFINNENQVQVEDDTVRIRLPYGLLGISDPSSATVLFDPESFVPSQQDQIGTRKTDAIVFDLPGEGIRVEYKPKTWEVPTYIERFKDGFTTLAEYFATLP